MVLLKINNKIIMVKKRILFVDNSTRCFYIFRLPVAKAFREKGYDVYVMSPAPYDYYLDKIQETGIIHIPYEISNKLSPLGDLKLLFNFYKQYHKLKPDYIVHYTIKPNIYGSIAAGMNRIRSMAVAPGTGSIFQKKGLLSKFVTLLYRLAFRYSKKVWVLNRDDYNAFLSRNIVTEKKLEILPGEGVDIRYFNNEVEYQRKDKFVFLYLGRMLREKGVGYLAEASEILKNKGITRFEIQLLGLVDGLCKDVISENEIADWERQGLVRYLGSIPDVRESIRQADCVILPTFYGEGIPRSLMEASAMKRVILATDNVGCREVVEDGINGFLCRPRDIDDLVRKMQLVMDLSEEELIRMGENGRRKMENEFEESLIVEKYLREIL